MPISMPDMSDSRNWFDPVPESRRRSLRGSRQYGMHIEIGGRQLLNFASNDYLGLRNHPEVCRAAVEAIQSEGLGSGASRLISGDHPALHQLEHELAAWKGYEACLLVGSGMLTNIGLLQALADRHTHLFTDRLNHASLIDGARLAGARVHRYRHNDMAELQALLSRHMAERRIIVSDGVFSMDGDCADLAGLIALAEAQEALLLIDDAHGTGSLGPQGRGLTAVAGIAGHPRLVEVGTFGKAFGGYGAFILGTLELIEGLRQRMRTLIYSTALPAALPMAMLESLHLIREGTLIQRLQAHIELFRREAGGLALMASSTAIQPLLLGSDEAALAAQQQLQDAGFFVPAIRPPTVPEGSARLRITLTAEHTEEQILALVAALKEATSGTQA